MIEVYDGVTVLLDHSQTFVDLMKLYVASDVVMCRSIPLTLMRKARDWVATLAPKSIKTFDELSKSFVAYFMSSKKKVEDDHWTDAGCARERRIFAEVLG